MKMSKWKGLKQADGRVHVVRSIENTDGMYDSDIYIVDSTSPFEANSKEMAQTIAEKELDNS